VRLSIPDFSSSCVVVAGDLMLDRYWHGAASRISPEAPVPVVRIEADEDRAGGAGNVALNIAALGGRVTVMGATGDDEEATALQRVLTRPGIDFRFVPVRGARTVTKLRIISQQQQLIRLDFEDGFVDFDSNQLLSLLEDSLKGAGALVLSDYAKGTLRELNALIAAARSAGVPVIVDPKGGEFSRYRGATCLTPNLAEFENVVGHCADEAEMVERAAALIERLGLEALLITRSERGMSLLRRDAPPVHIPTRAREVYDVTGAGDTVVATLAAAMAAGSPLPEAAALANLAAGIVVGKLGTASVTVTELHAAMQAHEPLPRGLVSEDELAGLIERSRASGERIVLTNGCFDILHAGHVAYLARARELGDRLIVAVNDDDSVRRLKGADRPVNPLDERMAVLAGLESVDWVVPFDEDTPERLICRLLPDVLIKGGDYKVAQIAGGECVRRAGGEVTVMPYIDGKSTSAIIETIRKRP
jgi:D-beta-D-heptose 7-phosphate kinase/D-beta-D-heptose 1-phosphate adenosyltransferase